MTKKGPSKPKLWSPNDSKAKPSIFFGYCRPRFPGQVYGRFFDSVLALIATGDSFLSGLRPISIESGPLLSRARNNLLKMFLEETDDQYFLSVDTDIVFTPTDLKTLLLADKPIIGSVYLTLDQKQEAVCAHLDESSEEPGTYTSVKLDRLYTDSGPTDPFEISGLGMGFTLIKRQVIQELSPIQALWPYAESNSERGYGEDLTFCLRAKEKGFSSWIHPSTKVNHIKTIEV